MVNSKAFYFIQTGTNAEAQELTAFYTTPQLQIYDWSTAVGKFFDEFFFCNLLSNLNEICNFAEFVVVTRLTPSPNRWEQSQ